MMLKYISFEMKMSLKLKYNNYMKNILQVTSIIVLPVVHYSAANKSKPSYICNPNIKKLRSDIFI